MEIKCVCLPLSPFPVSSDPLEAVTLTPSKVNCVLQLRRKSGIAVTMHNLLVAGHGASDRSPKIIVLSFRNKLHKVTGQQGAV